MPIKDPRQGEYHTKTLVRIADSTPLNLFMVKDPAHLPKTITIQKWTVFRDVEEGLEEISTELFLKTYLPGDDNEFYKISDTVYVDSADGKMVRFKQLNEQGKPSGNSRGMKKDFFLEDYPIYVVLKFEPHGAK